MKAKAFDRIIGIDYSGSNRPTRRISGLAVCSADVDAPPHIVCGPKEGSQNWTRKEIAKWLVEQLREENKPTLVSIDHAFSFPIDYFKEYGLPEGDWARFLTDFREYWPTHEDDKQVKDILKAQRGRKRCDTAGRKYHRLGDPKWTRLTDDLVPGAKGVFDFKIKQGQVATSTHAGLPWLLYLRRKLEKSGPKVHFWPFDGWKFDEGVSVVAEVYPALWKGQVDPAWRVPAWRVCPPTNTMPTSSLRGYHGRTVTACWVVISNPSCFQHNVRRLKRKVGYLEC